MTQHTDEHRCPYCPSPEEIRQRERDAAGKTCSQVLEESILEIIDLGYENGMTPDDVDWVLNKVIEDRAKAIRATLKLHVSDRNEKPE